jgi:hypothetical protein
MSSAGFSRARAWRLKAAPVMWRGGRQDAVAVRFDNSSIHVAREAESSALTTSLRIRTGRA